MRTRPVLHRPAAPATSIHRAGKRLLRFLATRRQKLSPLLILTHDFPDPDALASAFALQHLAQSDFEIPCRIVYGGEVGRTENRAMVKLLKIPIHKVKRAAFRKFAGVALVDTQPSFENNVFPKNGHASIVIDQHPSTTKPDADFVVVDPECGATCVIVARALLSREKEIPTRVATALAYGILTDTLDLYRARRPEVVQTYLDVLKFADMRALARIRNPIRPRRYFSTLGLGIVGAQQFRRVLITHLGAVDTPDRVAQVAEFLLAYRRALWSMVTGRYKGRLHASLRTTRTDVQAGEVLRDTFGNPCEAGGHGPIAGGSSRVGKEASEETWANRERELQSRLLKRLRISARVEPRKPFNY